MRRFGIRLLLICFGLLLALLLAEFGVRLLYGSLPQNLQIALRDVRVSPFSDQRLAPAPLWQDDSDYQMIVRPEAVDLLQAGSPTVMFPVTSYAWWGGRVGFRSPQPTDGNVQAVALGDSHTFCFTRIEDCWVTKLAGATNLPISNLGQPVTGSVSHERLFYDFVAKPELGLKQPRLVLWQFYGNDYNDDYGLAALNGTNQTPPPTTTTSTAEPSALQRWLRQNSVVYAMLDALTRHDVGIDMFVDPHRVIDQGVDIFFGQTYLRDAFDMTQPRNLEGEALSHAAILKTRELVEQNGGDFLLILIPTKEEVYHTLTEPKLGQAALDALAQPRLRMLEFCAAQQLACFDLLSGLQAAADQHQQLFFPTDPHLNAAGNALVADLVATFLRDHGLAQ
jgi:hypothetical protein